MDAIRIDCAPSPRNAELRDARQPNAETPAADLRLLSDWELALASGGEYAPEWP
jgi:hypothetical protein